jgi:hypothetical protein
MAMPASLLLFGVIWGGLSPEQALERALDAVEPPPAMRAAFRATLASGAAVRRIEYDPYAPPAERFKITMVYGEDEELDAVVQGWKEEGQADVRIFADDLRQSLGEARLVGHGEAMAIDFRHKVSANDGPLDKEFSARMVGRLSLDADTGYLSQVQYNIERPVRLEDGTTLDQYNQVYNFGYSERWGVSYVTSYELEARGGRWGMSERRTLRVTLTDVAFGLAGDAEQTLVSKSDYPSGFIARFQR